MLLAPQSLTLRASPPAWPELPALPLHKQQPWLSIHPTIHPSLHCFPAKGLDHPSLDTPPRPRSISNDCPTALNGPVRLDTACCASWIELRDLIAKPPRPFPSDGPPTSLPSPDLCCSSSDDHSTSVAFKVPILPLFCATTSQPPAWTRTWRTSGACPPTWHQPLLRSPQQSTASTDGLRAS